METQAIVTVPDKRSRPIIKTKGDRQEQLAEAGPQEEKKGFRH